MSGLWYGTRERVRTMILPVYGVLAVAGACALATVLHRLARLSGRRRIRRRADRWRGAGRCAAPGGPAAAAAAAAHRRDCSRGGGHAGHSGGGGRAAAGTPARRCDADLARRAPVGASYARTFAWLARSTPPGGVAAYDRHLEMMTWSWADAGVRPLFGIPPLRDEDRADYAQRFRAWDWLVANPGAAPAGCLVRRYGVRYVVVGGGPGARVAGPLQPAAAGGQPPGRPRAPRRRHPGLRGQRGRASLPGRALIQGRRKARCATVTVRWPAHELPRKAFPQRCPHLCARSPSSSPEAPAPGSA